MVALAVIFPRDSFFCSCGGRRCPMRSDGMEDSQGSSAATGACCHGRASLAVAILALAALGNLQLSVRTLMIFARDGGRDDSSQLVEHFQQLDSHLPATGRIGYLEARHGERPRILEGGRLAVAQYALAPRIVDRFRDQSVVILDGEDPAAFDDLLRENEWRLTADLPGGLKLYCLREEE